MTSAYLPHCQTSTPAVKLSENRYWSSPKKRSNVFVRETFGHHVYLSILHEVDVLVGNSSSGIIEAPAVNTLSINVGGRQDGRELASSVTQCGYDTQGIKISIQKALQTSFNMPIRQHPYYKQGTTNSIMSALGEFI